jgi:hypothetical protein
MEKPIESLEPVAQKDDVAPDVKTEFSIVELEDRL